MPLPEAKIHQESIERAQASGGASADPIYAMIRRIVVELPRGGTLVDVGCGAGGLHREISDRFDRYVGCDVVEYPGLPKAVEFLKLDLNSGKLPLANGSTDIVIAAETVEHVENPRGLVREMARVIKRGGFLIVTTPNNLSFLGKLTLVLKNQFNAFTETSYPAHITALLEIDLVRMAKENQLTDIRIAYSGNGRVPGAAVSFPAWLSYAFPRLFSDNVLLLARKTE